jgi:quercetin dioxygenase-like cupin family protein
VAFTISCLSDPEKGPPVEKCKVDFDALPWQSPLPGARYKVFQQGNRRLRLVEFSRGFVERDWCVNGHIGYVLDGEMDVDFDGNLVHFSAGDGVFIPAGAENRHMARVLTDVVRLVLVEEA